jgi:cysteinyl-tRNA synthetase
VSKGYGYATSSGVYFDVSKAAGYGGLSHQDTEQLKMHRIEPDPEKRNALDFALWKKASPGELGFESPWGYGRPGWHIECSVMSRKHLGEQLDIHGGALDLIFPHHENEIAQSEALTGKKFVKYWLHTGFLYSSGEKMSKSLGNIIPVREFLKKHSPEALRLFVLQTHYRSPVDYSEENISNSQKAVERLMTFRSGLAASIVKASDDGGSKALTAAENLREEFIRRMDDDFNTVQALAAIFEFVREVNQIMSMGGESKESLLKAAGVFDELTGVLGLTFKSSEIELTPDEKDLIEERNTYRREKKWAESDEIRDILKARGIKLTDRADGTTAVERL